MLTEQCIQTALRCAGVAILAVLVGVVTAPLLEESRHRRRVAWTLILIPLLTPVLVVGYAYSGLSVHLVRNLWLRELLYDLLLLMKLGPVACLVLHFAPSPMSAEARHCLRLRPRRGGVRELAFSARCVVFGMGRALAICFGLVFLLAFTELEMASLMNVRSWTVALFDAQTGGMLLDASLRLASVPAATGVAVLAGVLFLLARAEGGVEASGHRACGVRTWQSGFAWCWLVGAVTVVTGVPAAIVLRQTVFGLVTAVRTFALGRAVAASVVFAALATASAYIAAGRLTRERRDGGRRGRGQWLLAGGACAPGLLGALLVSLLVLSVFQCPPLKAVYDTPVPLVVALAIVAMPFAIVLRLFLQPGQRDTGIHSARLLVDSTVETTRRRARGVLWTIQVNRQFWVLFLLFCWTYFDLTASAILAPPGMGTVTARLYNLMHYGQTPVLSAMVCLTVLVPVTLLVFGNLVKRWTLRTGSGR